MKASIWLVMAAQAAAMSWHHSTGNDIQKRLANGDETLLAFISSQSDSSTFASQWGAVAMQVKTAKSLDCSAVTSLCADLDVHSFPAIRLYGGQGTMTRYRGERTEDSIVAFHKRVQRAPVTQVAGAGMKSFVTSDNVVFVAHVNENDEFVSRRFETAAHRLHSEHTFGRTPTTEPSSFTCHNNVDGVELTETDVAKFDLFVDRCTEKLISPLDRRTELRVRQSGKSIVYYFGNSSRALAEYIELMRPLAKRYRPYLIFVTVNSTEQARTMGLQSGKGLVVENPHAGHVYPYRGREMDIAGVETFIADISAGRVSPWGGSESGRTWKDEL